LTQQVYDIGIVGGGLAGLSLAIQSAKSGYSVVLIEKESYPFHKVCGEYISLESWPFLQSLGVPLSTLSLPIIKKLTLSAPNGKLLTQALPLGGFGISRYTLDAMLKDIAIKNGVTVFEKCKADDIIFENDNFIIKTATTQINCTVCCGSFGKRSNIDVKWNRSFILQKSTRLNNYIGVKYHVKNDFANNEIALHNFKDGYCGISKIEDDLCCICYLTTANNLKISGNSIATMEKNILYQNPLLKNILENAVIVYDKPLAIAQISFAKKEQIENHVLLIGDAAGLITPLCGNGMSMALHASKIAFECVDSFLKKEIGRGDMEKKYEQKWKKTFSTRLKIGRIIQSLFGKKWITNIFIAAIKNNGSLKSKLIKLTHGEPF
jgi:menaquinone-9 beta-reductase